MYLTANVIRQLAVVPDVVFLNCCYLAQIGFNRLAAGVARELMAIGVRAVVAAGWPVDDQAARTFAERFYQALFEGQDFGDAVGHARDAARDSNRASLTWGAYQCYGDPGFRLDVAPGRREEDRRSPVSREDVLGRVRAIAVNASDVGRADFGRLARHRNELISGLAALERAGLAEGGAWSDRQHLDGEVSFELGRAYADLGDLERGVLWWRRAVASESGYPQRIFEDLANIEVRLAQQRARTDGLRSLLPDSSPDLLKAADAHLEEGSRRDPTAEDVRRAAGPWRGKRPRQPPGEAGRAQRWQPPLGAAERYRIRGSLAKKKAVLENDRDAQQALVRQSADHYHTAYLIEEMSGRPSPDPYSTLNWLQLDSLVRGSRRSLRADDDLLGEIEQELDRARTTVGAGLRDRSTTPSFWDLAGSGDVKLTRLRRSRTASRQEVRDTTLPTPSQP